MVDLFGADKGNISLPPRLQSPEVLDGEPDDLKQVMILNMQKTFYQVRITDILKRIHRLQFRNTELEDSCIAEEILYSQTDVETADQITQLNRQIFGELEKITDHQKRIKIVQNWRMEEKQAHLDKVEAANAKYAKIRLKIMSEIKTLNAKINVLEEYKMSKTDLRNKLIARNNLIDQREEEVKQRCEQIQRKFKIGREKLKKEMYARLRGLAETFQIEVAASMAKPIHRLMRENIFVKNELIDIVRESVPKKEKMKQRKVSDDQAMYDIVISKKDKVEHLITSKIQENLMVVIKEQHARVKDCLEKLKQSESKINTAENTFESTKIQTDKMLQNIGRLETGLHRQQTQLGLFRYLRDKSKIELKRCTDVLYDAKYAVTCALNMTDTGKDILKMGDKQLMSYLLNILDKGDKQRWKNRTPSLATVQSPEDSYKIGALSFEASHIELSPTQITIEKRPSELSIVKTPSSLRAKLSENFSARSQIKSLELDLLDFTEEYEVLTDEMLDEISNKETSLSLGSRKEELEQQPLQSEAAEDEEPEVETTEESESEVEISTEMKEKVIEDTILNNNETDNNEQTINIEQTEEDEFVNQVAKGNEAVTEVMDA